MKKNKIAFIVKELPPYRFPFFKLIDELYGENSTIILDDKRNDNVEALNLTIKIKYLKKIRLPEFLFVQNRFKRIIPVNLFSILFKERFNFVVCPEYSIHTLIAILYKFIFPSVKIIVWSSLTLKDERISFKGQQIIRKIIRRKTDAFFCYSDLAIEYLINYGIKKENCSLVENCTDVLKFVNNFDSNKFNRKNEIIKLLYVGALVKEKGLHNLFESLKNFNKNNWQLSIVGDGLLKNELLKFSEKYLNNKVVFKGKLYKEHLFEEYLKSDIFIFPSFSDVWGHVIDEAMSLGCAVISSDMTIAANQLILNKYNGIIYKTNNNSELLEALTFLFENPSKIKEFGKKAHETMLQHHEKNSINGIKNTFERLGYA